jgi:folate-binding protein YgfZ
MAPCGPGKKAGNDNRRMSSSLTISGIVPLAHWGVIRARGADAASFLHSQLTNDFANLGPAEARLAGYCSPKGRLLASFVAWRAGDEDILLACDAGVLPATLKRLSMFVLRARCKLTDATAEVPLFGVAGAPADAQRASLPVWGRLDVEGGQWIRLPDAGGTPRALMAGTGLDGDAPTLTLEQWRWLEVHSGVAVVEAATVEKFVPQMLNFELVGGVNFQKGCYPGQEIVARSQYRGTVKRRTFLFDVDGAALAGQDVFDAADASQPAGLVANAAPQPEGGGSSALVEVKLAALDGTLHLGAPDGPTLRRRELPYAVPVDADHAA